MQCHEERRHQNRDQPTENHFQQVAHHHVRIETDAERKQPSNISNDFDRKHNDCNRQHGSTQVFQITNDAVLPDPLQVVIQEGRHGATERDLDVRGRRLKRRNQTQQIAQTYEDA